jgi:hypothetical protein
MSHNIRPAEEALECADCHGGKSTGLEGKLFAGTTPLYFPYDPEVENAAYFDKKIDRAPTEEEYAEHIREELYEAGYGKETTETESPNGSETVSPPEVPEITVPTITEKNVTIKIPSDNIEIKVKVDENATIDTTDVPNTKDELEKVAEELGVKKIFAAIKVVASSTFRVEFDITGLDPDKLTVKTSKGIVVDKDVSGNTLTATIDPTRAGGNSITVALVEEPETAETPAGGGGGGCSMTPSAGLGGSISYLLGLLPLAFLRRRKEN